MKKKCLYNKIKRKSSKKLKKKKKNVKDWQENNDIYRNKIKTLNSFYLMPSIFSWETEKREVNAFFNKNVFTSLFSVSHENILKARDFRNNAIPLGIYLLKKIFLTFSNLTLI